MNNKIFWNPETMAAALDVSQERLRLLVASELIPYPILVGESPLWRVSDVFAWARQQEAGTLENALAAFDAREQNTDKHSEPERDEICCNCRYYEWEKGDDPRGGYCYFHAPRPMLSYESEANYGFHQEYPHVDLANSCGQFKPMKELTHAAK